MPATANHLFARSCGSLPVPVLLPVLALLALVGSACGSSDDPGTDASTIGELLAAAGADDEPTSSRFEGTLEATVAPDSELPGSFTMSFSGAQDPANEATDVSIELGEFMQVMAEADDAGGPDAGMLADLFDEPLRTITIGDTVYVQWALITMFAGESGAEWVQTDGENAGDLAANVGGDSFVSGSDALAPFLDADAEIVEVGTETIRDAEAVHYRAEVAMQDYLDSLSADERAVFDERFDMSDVTVDTVPVDIWIDDDGRVVRMTYSMSDSSMIDGVDGVESISVSIDSFDFGADVEITPPPADKVIDDDELGFDPGA